MRRWVADLWAAWRLWDLHDCVDLSAAFAYHTLQSSFPILLIILSVASRIFGRDDGLTEQILAWSAQVLPDSALSVVQPTLDQLYRQRGGAGFLGVAVLLVTASNAYLSLQRGTDHLWSFSSLASGTILAPPKGPSAAGGMLLGVRTFLLLRLRALASVVVVVILFVFDQLTINLRLIGVQAWRGLTDGPLGWISKGFFPVSTFVDLLFSLVLASAVALALLRLLPSRRIRLQPLLPASLLIGAAYTLLNLAVGRSIVSLGSRFQAYGLIGGVLVFTLWVWLLGLIFYFGVAYSVVLTRTCWCGDPHQQVRSSLLRQGPR